jgi:predicted negative regulator of RcsB-dependent stress response
VINDYGMSKAADLALAQVGHAKFTNKQYDDAIDYYEEFSAKSSDNEAYETLTFLALAACHEAKGEMKKAAGILDGIIETSDNPFRENAMLNLERIYRLDNQPEKAEKILKTFAEEYANSPFHPMVKARI